MLDLFICCSHFRLHLASHSGNLPRANRSWCQMCTNLCGSVEKTEWSGPSQVWNPCYQIATQLPSHNTQPAVSGLTLLENEGVALKRDMQYTVHAFVCLNISVEACWTGRYRAFRLVSQSLGLCRETVRC